MPGTRRRSGTVEEHGAVAFLQHRAVETPKRATDRFEHSGGHVAGNNRIGNARESAMPDARRCRRLPTARCGEERRQVADRVARTRGSRSVVAATSSPPQDSSRRGLHCRFVSAGSTTQDADYTDLADAANPCRGRGSREGPRIATSSLAKAGRRSQSPRQSIRVIRTRPVSWIRVIRVP